MDTQTAVATSPVYTLAADLIAAFPDAAATIGRALDILTDGWLERTDRPNVWLVGSRSRANKAHTTTPHTCSCESYQRFGGPCLHQWAIRIFAAQERLDADAEQGLDPDAPIALELSGAGWLALVLRGEPFEADPPPADDDDQDADTFEWDQGEWLDRDDPATEPRPPGVCITRIPYTPEQAVFAAELGMLPDDAA